MCPECGGIRSRTRESGHDLDGRRIRYRVCETCQAKFCTLEVTLPPSVSFHVINAYRKWRNRMAMRRKRGYQGGLGGHPLKPEPHLIVSVKMPRQRE